MRRLALLALLGLGCRQDQWLVYVATDAPLPQLGDQLVISVYSQDHAPIEERALTQLAAQEPYRSFGITAPPVGQRLWVRARLTRSLLTATPAQTYIDAAGWLGAPHGRAPVALVLHLRCFGVATQYPSPGRLETCGPEGQLAPAVELPALADPRALPSLGSAVQIKDCPPDAVPAGMRCIPGGVLLLGEQGVTAPPNEPAMTPERLLTLPPFALDEEELSVRELIALRTKYPMLDEPQRRDAILRPDCTYEGMAQREGLDLPLNCVSGILAAVLCEHRGPGFRLPSEAEWEYAAGNGDRETIYSFGNGGEGVQALCDRDLLSQSVCDLGAIAPGSGDDLCPRAVLARGHTSDRRSCIFDGRGRQLPSGPVARNQAELLGGRPEDQNRYFVRGLLGNLAEWTQERGGIPYSDPCWQTLSCPAPTNAQEPQSVRGSHWMAPLGEVRVSRRFTRPAGAEEATLGVRCLKTF